MARRFYQDAGRIIISKPGFDAGPALADENKLFDSNWFFSASIIAAGSFPFGGYPITINFPQQPYVPAAEVWCTTQQGFYSLPGVMHLGGQGLGGNPASRIYNDHITITNEIQNGLTPSLIHYVVYGLSQ